MLLVRPTNSGITMCGKTTTSRSGNIGNSRDSAGKSVKSDMRQAQKRKKLPRGRTTNTFRIYYGDTTGYFKRKGIVKITLALLFVQPRLVVQERSKHVNTTKALEDADNFPKGHPHGPPWISERRGTEPLQRLRRCGGVFARQRNQPLRFRFQSVPGKCRVPLSIQAFFSLER